MEWQAARVLVAKKDRPDNQAPMHSKTIGVFRRFRGLIPSTRTKVYSVLLTPLGRQRRPKKLHIWSKNLHKLGIWYANLCKFLGRNVNPLTFSIFSMLTLILGPENTYRMNKTPLFALFSLHLCCFSFFY